MRQPVSPQSLETRAKVLSALRHLGFRKGEVRAAMEQLRGENAPKKASFDWLLREALTRFHRPAGRGNESGARKTVFAGVGPTDLSQYLWN
jgi:hypothetical protein